MNKTVETNDILFYAKNGDTNNWTEVKRLDDVDIPVNEFDKSWAWDDNTVVATFEIKTPKFWRCKNRKRFKKLMMSLGHSRDLVETYFHLYSWMRTNIKEYNPSYQELWNEIRINSLGF